MTAVLPRRPRSSFLSTRIAGDRAWLRDTAVAIASMHDEAQGSHEETTLRQLAEVWSPLDADAVTKACDELLAAAELIFRYTEIEPECAETELALLTARQDLFWWAEQLLPAVSR